MIHVKCGSLGALCLAFGALSTAPASAAPRFLARN